MTIPMRLPGWLTIALAILALPVGAWASTPSFSDRIRTRAEAEHFDGSILIGEPDGTFKILTIGPDPVPADAVWRWASITKQMTAVIAMQEVAAGRIDLDTPVTRYWPEWKAPQGAHIRIRDLLRHDSGLPQPDESPADADGVPAFYRSAAATPEASANSFCAGPARAAPPAAFEYNNCDTIVLAEVLHRVTGKPFEELLTERISRKVGAKSIGLYPLGPRPAGHVQPNGEYSAVDPLLNMGVYGASGGAYGTIRDLWRFDHALLSGALLRDGEREDMWQSSRENGFYGFFQWIFPSRLSGCAAEERVVEWQGLIAGFEHRNYLLPRTGRAVIFFSRHRPANYGDPWKQEGFAYDVLSMVNCR